MINWDIVVEGMNWAAWGLSALLLLVMLRDFVRVERQRRRQGEDRE